MHICYREKMNSFVTLLLFVSCVSTSAIPSVVLRPEVKLINISWTIYACPSDGAADDQTTAFVLPNGNGYVRPNDVVISKQAGGMMHKISHSASLGTYGVFLGKIAELDDVFEQVNISEPSQETEEIERPESQESVPDSNLIKTLTSRNGFVSGNTTVVKLRGRSKVWKCAGHLYQGENETSHVTFYLVIPRRESDHINVDDVLVGSSSGGFLEKVTEIVSIPSPWRAKFVHTELLFCGNLEYSSDVFRINEIRRGQKYTSCIGGDGIPGLQMFQRRTPRSVSVGSVIPGRPSQEFAAKVLRSFQKDGYNFFEVSPVESIEDGEVTVASTGITTDRHARQKRATFTAGKRYKATFPVTLGKVKVPCGTFTASAKAIFMAYPRVSITLGWSRPFLHRIKASLDSSVTLRVTLRLDFKCRVSHTGPKKAKFNHPIDNRHLVSLCIPIWAGLCIPVGILADLKVKYVLEAQGEGFAELSLERTGSVEMSASWSSSSVVSSPPPDFTLSSPDPTLNGGLTRDQTFASATLTITPALKVHVPNLKTISRLLRAAGWWIRKVLRKLFKVENQRRIQPILEFVVSAPLVGCAKVTACPNDCDPPKDKFKVEGHAGLPESIDGDLTVKVPLTSIAKTWPVFSIPGKHYDEKKCFASNIIKCNGPPRTTPTPPTEEPTTPLRPTTSLPSSTTEPSTPPTTSSPSTIVPSSTQSTQTITSAPTMTESTPPATATHSTSTMADSSMQTTYTIISSSSGARESTSMTETPSATTSSTSTMADSSMQTTYTIISSSPGATESTSMTETPSATTSSTSSTQSTYPITSTPTVTTEPTSMTESTPSATNPTTPTLTDTSTKSTPSITSTPTVTIKTARITNIPPDGTNPPPSPETSPPSTLPANASDGLQDTTNHTPYETPASTHTTSPWLTSFTARTTPLTPNTTEDITTSAPNTTSFSTEYPDVDMCALMPCENGGICADGQGETFSCVCLPNFTGQLCQNRVKGWTCTCQGCIPETFECTGDPRLPECDCVNCDCDI